MNLKPKYSGNDSKKFWSQINAIKDGNIHDQAYTLGVVLQNIEADILRLLRVVSQEKIRRRAPRE